jgi:phosphoribosyl-AMP cyclohydrolase/phosphoribosyl-ATP pyrophosphohydrolase/phosphoribosyl-AMP cyclohydrolase
MPVAVPIDATPEQFQAVKYDSNGLVPAIVQDHRTGEVLMMAYMNEGTLAETLESGRTVFWSRSRQERWRKGDTSGERQWIRGAYYDCDGDTLLFLVEQEGGGACHTGNRSCFYRPFGSSPEAAPPAFSPAAR